MEKRLVDFSDSPTQDRLSPSALIMFVRMMEIWRIEESDAVMLLGGVPAEIYRSLQKNVSHIDLSEGALIRISLLLGIFKALNILHGQELADEWVNLPNLNSLFQGSTPLAYMLGNGIPGMTAVRRFLDGRRQG